MDKIYIVVFYDKKDKYCIKPIDFDTRFWTDKIQAQKFVDLWNKNGDNLFYKLNELKLFKY